MRELGHAMAYVDRETKGSDGRAKKYLIGHHINPNSDEWEHVSNYKDKKGQSEPLLRCC